MTAPATLLIVPGYKGSGPEHWQTWLQQQVPNAQCIDGIDWDAPVLAQWAGRVRDAVSEAAAPLRIVAHSFGCLAAVVAAADRPDRVAQLILAAPADPSRFDFTGLHPEGVRERPFSLEEVLPVRPLNVHGCVIASRNDPWLAYAKAAELARLWGLTLHDAGNAGHLNTDSGYGPWPFMLDLVTQPDAGAPQAATAVKKGRGSALAAVRQLTRLQLEKPRIRKFRD